MVSLSHINRRPRARGDPYAAASHWRTPAETLRNKQRRWLWVPAFAGATWGGRLRASIRRPRARGDPYAAASHWRTPAETLRNNQRRWLWVPAFAGATWGGR